jgi:hypothetical protein
MTEKFSVRASQATAAHSQNPSECAFASEWGSTEIPNIREESNKYKKIPMIEPQLFNIPLSMLYKWGHI